MVKAIKGGLMAVCAAAAVSAGVQGGEPPPLEMELGADLMSKYVWRGILVHDETAFQPSLTLSSGNLSANVWADFSDDDMVDDVTEVDYTISYGFSPSEAVDMELGAILYTFDNDFETTSEVYVSAGLPDMLLSPSATLYYDVDEAEGAYLSLGAEHSLPLGEQATLTLSGALGIMDAEQAEFYMTVDEAGISDASLAATVAMDLTEALSMSVSGSYSVIVDDEYRDAMPDDDNFVFGVNFSYTF